MITVRDVAELLHCDEATARHLVRLLVDLGDARDRGVRREPGTAGRGVNVYSLEGVGNARAALDSVLEWVQRGGRR